MLSFQVHGQISWTNLTYLAAAMAVKMCHHGTVAFPWADYMHVDHCLLIVYSLIASPLQYVIIYSMETLDGRVFSTTMASIVTVERLADHLIK